MSPVRRTVSLALISALALANLQAAELHVHARSLRSEEAHSHGPASHHHDAVHHTESRSPGMRTVDPDDTVISVQFTAAAPRLVKPIEAAAINAAVVEPNEAAATDSIPIVARAHSPPSTRQHSLRAPPPPSSL